MRRAARARTAPPLLSQAAAELTIGCGTCGAEFSGAAAASVACPKCRTVVYRERTPTKTPEVLRLKRTERVAYDRSALP